MPTREIMDIREAAEYLGISDDTLYNYAAAGYLPAFKLGNRWRFSKQRLDEWMAIKMDTRPVKKPRIVVP